MAALFEPDRKRIGERINYAKQLILSRQRELFTSRVDSIEARLEQGPACLACAQDVREAVEIWKTQPLELGLTYAAGSISIKSCLPWRR
jgi:hypothetical protein